MPCNCNSRSADSAVSNTQSVVVESTEKHSGHRGNRENNVVAGTSTTNDTQNRGFWPCFIIRREIESDTDNNNACQCRRRRNCNNCCFF